MIPDRVLIKISGEAISGKDELFSSDIAIKICNEIKNVIDLGISVLVVVGGGNIIRGRDFINGGVISRETADSIGMLATIMNGLFLKELFQKIGIDSEIVKSHHNPENLSSKNKLLIFVGGLGYPYFSTDTVSVIAALLYKCDIILKATKSNGIYDKDPLLFQDAKFIENLTYEQAIKDNIQIMDQTAFSIIGSNKRIPIYVFSLKEENCFVKALNKTIKMSIVN
ncbi:MAG: hypothetical protein LBE97_02130 [Holosporales bacterium]|jgi:uridylate kinase|nr:hypothetical protein [Holosporales bacterium]